MKSIVLVEDDPQHARWLQRCIERVPDAQLTGHARDLASALALLTDTALPEPDVLMLDVRLGDGTGLDLLPQQRRWWPRTRVLVVSQFGDDRLVAQAMREGAQGYVVKDGDDTAVVEALQAVLRGLYTLSPSAARHFLSMAEGRPRWPTKAALLQVLNGPSGPGTGTDLDAEPVLDLTPREHEVLGCLAEGLSYDETARQLALSISTVQTHVRNLYRKLGASSKVGAVQRAHTLGLFGLRP